MSALNKELIIIIIIIMIIIDVGVSKKIHAPHN